MAGNGVIARPKGASDRSKVEPFIAMDVMRAAIEEESRGTRVIHMEVGQPGAAVPTAVRLAAESALAEGKLGYTEALGRRELRLRIARHYGEAYGVDVPVDHV